MVTLLGEGWKEMPTSNSGLPRWGVTCCDGCSVFSSLSQFSVLGLLRTAFECGHGAMPKGMFLC